MLFEQSRRAKREAAEAELKAVKDQLSEAEQLDAAKEEAERRVAAAEAKWKAREDLRAAVNANMKRICKCDHDAQCHRGQRVKDGGNIYWSPGQACTRCDCPAWLEVPNG
jgi:ribosomal protein S13